MESFFCCERELVLIDHFMCNSRLVGCGARVEKEHIEVVSSALSADPSPLRHLDLSYNSIPDDLLTILCDALKSPHCRLETLRSVGFIIDYNLLITL